MRFLHLVKFSIFPIVIILAVVFFVLHSNVLGTIHQSRATNTSRLNTRWNTIKTQRGVMFQYPATSCCAITVHSFPENSTSPKNQEASVIYYQKQQDQTKPQILVNIAWQSLYPYTTLNDFVTAQKTHLALVNQANTGKQGTNNFVQQPGTIDGYPSIALKNYGEMNVERVYVLMPDHKEVIEIDESPYMQVHYPAVFTKLLSTIKFNQVH